MRIPRKRNQQEPAFETWGWIFGPFFLIWYKYLFDSFFVPASPQQFQEPVGHAKDPAEVPDDRRVLRVRRLWFPTSDRVETWLIPSGMNFPWQYHARVDHGLTQPSPVPPLQVLTSTLSRSFFLKRRDKILEEVVRGQLHQIMVDLWCCLVWFVPEDRSKVSRRSEVGNYNGALSSPGYHLALLRDLLQCPRALRTFPCRSRYDKRNWLGHIFWN